MEKFIQRYFRKLTTISLSNLFRLGHHHFTEFIKVHGAGSVFIELLKDSLELFFSERSKEFTNKTSQGLCGDEAISLLVIYSKREKVQYKNQLENRTKICLSKQVKMF